MFPFDIDEKGIEDVSEKIPKEYGIDFRTGQLNGKIVTGKEALKVWAFLALKTARYRFPQYSWDYGSELDYLIGRSYSSDYIEANVKRMIEECLKVNKHIKSIDDLTCSFDDGKLTASFTIKTDYGEEEMNV